MARTIGMNSSSTVFRAPSARPRRSIELLDARKTPLDLVLLLEATLETLRGRVLNRLVCLKCGEIVSLGLHVPNVSAPCPKCGGQLGKRSDDTAETLTRRMREYKEKTEPLLGFYEEQCLLCRVDSADTPERVFASIARIHRGAMIPIKNDREIEKMRDACRAASASSIASRP